MADHFGFSVVVGGSKLQSISSIHVSQGIFNHNHFEVVLPMSALAKVQDGDDPFAALQKCIGKDIEITTSKNTAQDKSSDTTNTFIGVITNAHVNGNGWNHAMVSLTGQSPTILMDTIPNTQGYSNLGIAAIYKNCVSKHLSGKIKLEDNLTYTEKLGYVVQYDESDFEFMKRLCFDYGEWFYYDGESLCLGLKPDTKAITLHKNSIRTLDYDYTLISTTPGIKARNYLKDEIFQYNPKETKAEDVMAKHAMAESNSVFTGAADCYRHLPSFGDSYQQSNGHIQKIVDVSNNVQKSRVMIVSGETNMLEIKVGSIIKLDGIQHDGEYVVVHVTHNFADSKTYSNRFRAIPKGSFFPPDVSFRRPRVHSSNAKVTNNSDPEKLGRVRVKFPWSEDVESPWIRMTGQHAGKNVGFYFVPEINDEVIVGFEGGSPDHPYVIGTVYNGKNSYTSHYNDQNKIKAIRTKGGNEIIFDDNGRLVIQNEKNTIELNYKGDGLIELKTDGHMEFTAAKTMTINTGEGMVINAGKTLEFNVGGDATFKGGGNVEFTSSQNLSVKAGSDLVLEASGDADLEGMNTTVKASGSATLKGTGSAEISASGNTTVKGAMVQIN